MCEDGWDADELEHRIGGGAVIEGAVTEANEMLVLDPTCPWCGKEHDVGETFEGRDTDCASCGKRIIAVVYERNGASDFMVMEMCGSGLGRRPNNHRTTQARWRKRGRR